MRDPLDNIPDICYNTLVRTREQQLAEPAKAQTARKRTPSDRAHLLYIWLLQRLVPHKTEHFKVKELAGQLGLQPYQVTQAISILRRTKPWLKFIPAGPRGWGVFWAPEEGYRKIQKSPPRTSSIRKDLRPSSDPSGDHSDTPQGGKVENSTSPPTHKTVSLRGKIMTRSEWEKRSWMKKWRRKSYKDPTLKWLALQNVDIVRIVGHFVWHSKRALALIAKKISAWLYWFASGDIPIPFGPHALTQFIFATLNAFISGKQDRLQFASNQ